MRRAAWLLVVFLFALGLDASTQQSPSPNPPPGTGVIVGRVVDANTSAPVPGVLVLLLLMKGTLANTVPTAEPRLITDSQGRFAFRALPAGDYMITATIGGASNYSPSGFIVSGLGSSLNPYLSGGFGQRRPGGPLQLFELAEGQRVGDVVIKMWKAGAVSGRVLDEVGEPLPNQVVCAVQLSPAGRLLTGPSVRTDDRGVYRLPGLIPGPYVVVVPQTQLSMPISIGEELVAGPPDPTASPRFNMANAPSPRTGGVRVGNSLISTTPDPVRFSAEALISNALPPLRDRDGILVYPTTFFPGATRLAQAARITLASGEERSSTDVQLKPVRAGSITGILVDDAGPVPSVGLHLMPADMGRDGSVLEAATTASDSRGAFSFPAVPAGQYTVLVWRTGGVPTSGAQQPSATPTRVGEMSGGWARQSVTVGTRPVESLTVTMHPPVTVSGQVLFEGASDQPVERLRTALFTIFPVDDLFRTPGPAPGGRTDPANGGRFSIKSVSPPGRFMLGVPSLPTPWTLQSITLAGRDVTDTPFEIADADVDGVSITFTDRPASISGTVAIPAGAESDVTVFLLPSNRSRWPDARTSTRTFRLLRAGLKGAFTIPSVVPGDYLIVAISDATAGDWPEEQFLARIAAVATPIRVAANQQVTTALKVSTVR
jgi:Carboxypeptidase regulatory-like domain